jgi:hypothetical protein
MYVLLDDTVKYLNYAENNIKYRVSDGGGGGGG